MCVINTLWHTMWHLSGSAAHPWLGSCSCRRPLIACLSMGCNSEPLPGSAFTTACPGKGFFSLPSQTIQRLWGGGLGTLWIWIL